MSAIFVSSCASAGNLPTTVNTARQNQRNRFQGSCTQVDSISRGLDFSRTTMLPVYAQRRQPQVGRALAEMQGSESKAIANQHGGIVPYHRLRNSALTPTPTIGVRHDIERTVENLKAFPANISLVGRFSGRPERSSSSFRSPLVVPCLDDNFGLQAVGQPNDPNPGIALIKVMRIYIHFM